MLRVTRVFLRFFFNDTATTEIYTLSLHDALPILLDSGFRGPEHGQRWQKRFAHRSAKTSPWPRALIYPGLEFRRRCQSPSLADKAVPAAMPAVLRKAVSIPISTRPTPCRSTARVGNI